MKKIEFLQAAKDSYVKASVTELTEQLVKRLSVSIAIKAWTIHNREEYEEGSARSAEKFYRITGSNYGNYFNF